MMKNLILASGSPRRKVLMECMGLTFDVIPSRFDEYLDDTRTPQEIAVELGFGKADEVADRYPDSYVIGGDLIVVVDGVQLAKPENAMEAKRMLQSISGRSHQAVGSVVLVSVSDNIHAADVAMIDIDVKEIPNEVMDAYVATGDSYDKAGGYARRHPLIAPYFSVHGDTQALTGLSTRQLRTLLEKHGIRVPFDQDKTDALFEKSSYEEMGVLV